MCMIKVIFKYSNTQIFLLQKKIKNTTGRPLSLLNESYRPDIIIIEFFFISPFRDMLHKKLQGKRNRRNGKQKYSIDFMFYTYMYYYVIMKL